MYPPKETLYKTAYAPLYNLYAKITSAFKDERGEWIFMCEFDNDPDTSCLFRKEELRNFCL